MKKWFLIFCFCVQTGCSSVSFSTLKTPDGDELTVMFCTPDRIEYLNLGKELYNLRAQFNTLESKISILNAEYYRLIAKGQLPTDSGRSSLKDLNELSKESESLKENSNHLTIKRNDLNEEIKRSGLSEKLPQLIQNIKESIALNKDNIEVNNERIKIIQNIKNLLENSDAFDARSEKIKLSKLKEEWYEIRGKMLNISVRLERFKAERFGFSVDVCYLLKEGRQLTNHGKSLAAELNDLVEEDARFVKKFNMLVIDSIDLTKKRRQVEREDNFSKAISYINEEIPNIQDRLEIAKNRLEIAEEIEALQKKIIDGEFF